MYNVGNNQFNTMMGQYLQAQQGQQHQQQGFGFGWNLPGFQGQVGNAFGGFGGFGGIGGGIGNTWYQDFLTQKNEKFMFQQQLTTMLLNHENAMNKAKNNAVIESNKIASEHIKAKQNIANDYQSSTYDNSLKNIQKVSQANGRYL